MQLSVYGIVVTICTVVVAVCVVKLLALAPNSKIVVSGANGYPVSAVATAVYSKSADELLGSSLLNRNKLTLNTNGIATKLQQEFPELGSVVVTVPLVGNRPIIYVAPSKPALNLQTSNGLFSIDANGYVLAQLSTPLGNLTLLKEASGRVPQPGRQYLAASISAFCTTTSYELKQGGVSVAYLDLPATSPYELDIYTTGKPYKIRFNLQHDAMQQSGAAIATIAKLGAETPQVYLDVRVPERAYYK
jgi:hypothetical protein